MAKERPSVLDFDVVCSWRGGFLQTCLPSVGAQLRGGRERKGSETPGLCGCEDVGIIIWEKEL